MSNFGTSVIGQSQPLLPVVETAMDYEEAVPGRIDSPFSQVQLKTVRKVPPS